MTGRDGFGHSVLFPKSVKQSSVSHSLIICATWLLTLGLVLTKPTGSAAYDMTHFPLPPLISARAWGDAQGMSRGYLTPTLTSPPQFFSLTPHIQQPDR